MAPFGRNEETAKSFLGKLDWDGQQEDTGNGGQYAHVPHPLPNPDWPVGAGQDGSRLPGGVVAAPILSICYFARVHRTHA